jgi:flagellar protein FlbD
VKLNDVLLGQRSNFVSHIITDGGIVLIKLTGLNNKEVIINAEHIEKLESVPESLITLINGNKYIVLESTDEIINKVIEYKNKIFKFGL